MADTITTNVDEARAIIDGWLTKAYPRAWQREYVARGIASELSQLNSRKRPADPLHDTEQAMSRGWR